MSLKVCRGNVRQPFKSSAPSEYYQNPFDRKLDDQRYWLLKLDIHQQRVSALRATRLNANSAFESDVSASFNELRSLVSAISRGETIASTGDLDRLLDQAVQHHGIPADIEEWANRLARDIDKLND